MSLSLWRKRLMCSQFLHIQVLVSLVLSSLIEHVYHNPFLLVIYWVWDFHIYFFPTSFSRRLSIMNSSSRTQSGFLDLLLYASGYNHFFIINKSRSTDESCEIPLCPIKKFRLDNFMFRLMVPNGWNHKSIGCVSEPQCISHPANLSVFSS